MPDNTVSQPKSPLIFENWRVLVVDDQRDNLELAAAILRMRGAEVKLVDNGLEALSILKQFDPTVILLDLAMPEMTGWDLMKTIRANEGHRHVPIIAVSVRLGINDEQTATDAGFDGYISKPFSIPVFIEKLIQIVDTVND